MIDLFGRLKAIYDRIGAPAGASVSADVAAIKSDTGSTLANTNKIDGAAVSGTPTASSLATFIATGGTSLGTALPVSKSLYDGLSGGIDAVNRIAGKMQFKATTIDLHNDAGTYDLATGTTADVVLEYLVFSPRVDVSDDVGGITGVSIQTDDTTAQVIINSTDGAKANLTAYAQKVWTGLALLRTGKKVQLTILGGTADANPTTCDVVIAYRSVANGGYLA
jgi:hypothetical protein